MEKNNDNLKYIGEIRFTPNINAWLNHKYICYFTVDSIKYNSVEQYLIFKKAELFNDEKCMKYVMMQLDPMDMHYLGRTINNYDDEKWKRIREEISYIGNKNKFLQNPELYKKLYNTKLNKLIYYSEDSIWGCGNNNDGENLLGKVLMRIRDNDMISISNIYLNNKFNDYKAYQRYNNIDNNIDKEFCNLNNLRFFELLSDNY